MYSVHVPRNVADWEMLFVICKKRDIPFYWEAPVEPNGIQWRTKQDRKEGIAFLKEGTMIKVTEG